MNFDDYQKQSRKTAVYPNPGNNYVYPTLGLTGEAGEVANKIKKILRKDSEFTDEAKHEISKELGDVIWYLAQLCTELGLSFDQVAAENLEKLLKRLEENKLHGSGDNR